MKGIRLIVCMSLFLYNTLVLVSQQRQPIRVGGNVQESKLIYKVEPLYPEAALAAQISGVVIMQVAVSEKGEVTDVRVLRGHPLLDAPAIDAVRQWRYSPTYLNGEPVAVIATVTVVFSLASYTFVSMDEFGNLRDRVSGFEGDALIQKLKGNQGTVVVNLSRAPFQIAEEKLRILQEQGISNISTSGPYILHNGRLFYATPGLAKSPELAVDAKRLADIARASGSFPSAIGLSLDPLGILEYRIFLSESGKVIAVQRLRGPEISEIEAELAHTPIITPALLGSDAVPAVVTVEIRVN